MDPTIWDRRFRIGRPGSTILAGSAGLTSGGASSTDRAAASTGRGRGSGLACGTAAGGGSVMTDAEHRRRMTAGLQEQRIGDDRADGGSGQRARDHVLRAVQQHAHHESRAPRRPRSQPPARHGGGAARHLVIIGNLSRHFSSPDGLVLAVRIAAPASASRHCSPARSRWRREGQRQRDRHGGALADLALHVDLAAVQRHQALDDRKPEAGAFVAALIGLAGLEERIADALADRRRRCRRRCRRRAASAALPRPRRDTVTRAAALGELDGVGDEVEQDLLEGALVAGRSPADPSGARVTRSMPFSRAFSASRSQQLTHHLRAARTAPARSRNCRSPSSTCRGCR